MLSPELQQYVLHGKEERNIEYKDSMSWSDNGCKLKILKAALAMANHFNGGVIVVGVKQKGNSFTPVGLSKTVYSSFVHDYIAQFINERADPKIQLTITCDEMNVVSASGRKKSRRFCIIQVAESRELPVISTRQVLYDDAVKAFPKNICTRPSAIYIRAGSPVESREINNQEEWRELLRRCIEKMQVQASSISKKILTPERTSQPSINRKTSNKFEQVLKRDKLI